VIFDIGKPGNERFATVAGTIQGYKNMNSIVYSSRKEIYACGPTGNVVFIEA